MVSHETQRNDSHEAKQPNEGKSLGSNMVWNTVGSLTYQGCLWLTTVLVVTLSNGYADSGALALAMTIGNMYDPIATFNMRVYQISDANDSYSQSDYIGTRITTLIGALVIIIPYSILVSGNPLTLATILAFLAFKVNELFCDALYGVDQKHKRMDYIGISQLIRGASIAAGFSLGMVAFRSINMAILCMLLLGVIITFAYDFPRASSLSIIRPRIDAKTVRELLRACLPLAMATLFLSMIVAVARQCYNFLYGIEALGIFAAVATPAVLIQAVARYLYSPVLVPLSEIWNTGTRSEILTAFKKILAVMFVAAIAAVFLFSLIGPPILVMVYGPSIANYTYLFPLVLASAACAAFMWFFSDAFVIVRSLKDVFLADGIALATCLIVMVPCELYFGMNGINYTVIISMLAGCAFAALKLIRMINEHHRETVSIETGSEGR